MATVTGYDLQVHLRYRNSIQNKETDIKFNVTREFYGKPRISQIFHGEII